MSVGAISRRFRGIVPLLLAACFLVACDADRDGMPDMSATVTAEAFSARFAFSGTPANGVATATRITPGHALGLAVEIVVSREGPPRISC